MNALHREVGSATRSFAASRLRDLRELEEAIALLAREPLARPAVFTVTGAEPGEMAVVARTEREARVLRGPVIVANDWQKPRFGWKARMGFREQRGAQGRVT